MKCLTGLCQEDVTTSSGDDISRNKLHSHVREKILGKVTKGILEICYGSMGMQQNVGLGEIYPPPLVLCVLKIGKTTVSPSLQMAPTADDNARDK